MSTPGAPALCYNKDAADSASVSDAQRSRASRHRCFRRRQLNDAPSCDAVQETSAGAESARTTPSVLASCQLRLRAVGGARPPPPRTREKALLGRSLGQPPLPRIGVSHFTERLKRGGPPPKSSAAHDLFVALEASSSASRSAASRAWMGHANNRGYKRSLSCAHARMDTAPRSPESN